jgi:AAA ATPase domain
MASLTATINQNRAMRIAEQRIAGFTKEFGNTHLKLARHAAFPLILTPDLLYQIWANFVPEAPWTAVARLLLSRLCREVGFEMYEMDLCDRNLLLRELKQEFGQGKFNDLSDFLLDYVAQRLGGDDTYSQDLREAQEWTALAYTKPGEAARELAQALNAGVTQEDMGEMLRLTSLVQTLAEPLREAGFEPLMVYSRGMESFARGDLKGAAAQLGEVERRGNQIQVADFSLVIPQQIFVESHSSRLNIPKLDLEKFYNACNPSRPLFTGDTTNRQYYIDFNPVRGGKIIEQLQRTITRLSPDEPTCQLFTGQIGCGKSTELWRLKFELEQQNFHVVYLESSRVLDMADVDVSDILLALAYQVSESLEAIEIRLKSSSFVNLYREIVDFLETPISLEAQANLSVGIAKIITKTKESPRLRRRLRDYLQPRIEKILQLINKELLEPANLKLKALGKKGLVVIVDNLDRVGIRPLSSGRSQPKHIFIDQGDRLRNLNCHIIYTIPLCLTFSAADRAELQQRLGNGVAPQLISMIPIYQQNGEINFEALALMRQMILVRAFPEIEPQQRLDVNIITQIFDSLETLDRLCLVSGGHVRNLLGMLFDCLREQDPPFDRNLLERVIRQQRDFRAKAIDDDEWELIFQVLQEQTVRDEIEYQTLVQSMFVFEYSDEEGTWFDVNPVLAETHKFKSRFPRG